MLRITSIETADEQKLILEGTLTEPQIAELASAWETARQTRGQRTCVVDLRGATCWDESGERILLQMKREGAQFLARGICTTFRLRQLGIRCGRLSGTRA